MQEASSSQTLDHCVGKYLTFALSHEVYATRIDKVLEIMVMLPMTVVPQCPPYVRGIVNLRGKIIPVVDLRMKFNMPERAYDSENCMVVTQLERGGQKMAVALIVDRVVEVIDFEERHLAHAPVYGGSLETDFVICMAKPSDKEVVIILDLSKALEDDLHIDVLDTAMGSHDSEE